MPNWPVGTKSKGNEGIAASLRTTPGSISYLEYGYAKLTHLKMATAGEQGRQVRGPDDRGAASGAGGDQHAREPHRLGDRTRPATVPTRS